MDLLRGFAVFGILFMNIVSMAYPFEAYTNPMAFVLSDYSAFGSANWWSGATLNSIMFSLNHVLFDQKMMGLFSLLFGASIMLMVGSLKDKGLGKSYYFKRNGWLILIGFLHSIFLYCGDVLLIYGICAFVLYWFAGWRPIWQFMLGIIVYTLPIIQQWLMQAELNQFSVKELLQLQEIWLPTKAVMLEAVESAQVAGYWHYVLSALELFESTDDYPIYDWYSKAIVVEAFLRSFGMMMIGMAFFSWGVLPNHKKSKSLSFYKVMLIVGFAVGLSLTTIGLWLNFSNEWHVIYSAVGGRILNHIATPFMVFAYIALLILWASNASASRIFKGFKQRLIAVGRMALSNYIMHSVIGLFLFNGIGLGLFGQLNRLELFFTVFLVCLCQLFFSSLWLKWFRYGPLEWVWRCLTYGKFVKLLTGLK